MLKTFMELIEAHQENVTMCSIEVAAKRIAGESELVLLDVRESAEHADASVPSAVNIPRGFLEFRIAGTCSEADTAILIHCKSGGRAVLAAKTLADMGYTNVAVVGGAFDDLLAAAS